ncbi:unnamed protein product [Pleuronectes platessa]|uniref:Uncharacterized protein n=1 Tax=Pleuronectes platessa TaxID=8262 RepID=A0A9N7UG51_PLEPL|nr:unnamed protein product [Pleuronectes platessa]
MKEISVVDLEEEETERAEHANVLFIHPLHAGVDEDMAGTRLFVDPRAPAAIFIGLRWSADPEDWLSEDDDPVTRGEFPVSPQECRVESMGSSGPVSPPSPP